MSHTVSFVHSTTDGDELLAYMARVSNPNAKQGETYSSISCGGIGGLGWRFNQFSGIQLVWRMFCVVWF